MKTKTKYFKASIISVLLFLFHITLSINAQTFDGNISIPSGNGNGSFYGDISTAGNFVFFYSADSITAYSAANGNYITSFAFPEGNNYGKYNPIFYNERYWLCDINVYGSSGVYIYNPQTEELLSINEDGQQQNDIDVPVGDCIYNPYQNHFLISENASFDDRAASVRVINNDASNTFITNIELIDSAENNAYYAKRMFIAPNGKLYVAANMRHNISNTPKIFVFEAKESGPALYSLIKVIDVGNMIPLGYNGIFEFYSAYFCFNPSDQSVYMTIHPTENIIDPYNSVPNTIFDSINSYTENNGFLVRISENSSSKTALNYPGKILCPSAMGANTNSRFSNKMYIIGNNFYEVEPGSSSELSVNSGSGECFNDITYSPKDDRIYCLRDDSLSKATHRGINVYCIDTLNDFYSFNNIHTIEGQATSLFNNPYDSKLYIHQKTDENKLGDTPVRLVSLDYNPENQVLHVDSISFEMASIYPEVDHNGDFRFYLYNTTSSVIDPYSNTMYIPNGGHSCVSKVSFTPYEPLFLEEGGWTWLSFPRMIRNFNDAVLIPDVLNDNIEPDNYQDSSKLQNLELGTPNIIESLYSIDYGWNTAGQLDSVRSTYGYKLYLKYNSPPDNNILFLESNLYDHFNPNCNNCTLDLVGADKYWVGYYYPISQNIIDAIPDEIEPSISVIKGQYFTCYGAPQSDGSVQWNCAINKRGTIINYGDMVEIIPVTGDSITNFYWTINNNSPTDQEKAETEYYDYTETSDYTPIFIELDTTDNPLEIGAFVNDSCIGASTVLPEDSVVLVPAYSDSLNGEIYFEEYYGTQKSNQPPITEYYVTNTETRIREKRLIHTREQQDYYIVSFRNTKTPEKEEAAEDVWIKCRPNPLRSNGTISCYVPDDGFAEIMLYNIMGTRQLVIHSGLLNTGMHDFTFSTKDISGMTLSNGTYILLLKSAEFQIQTKIVIIQ